MSSAIRRCLTAAIVAILVCTMNVDPAQARSTTASSIDPPQDTTPFGALVTVARGDGRADQLQLFAGPDFVYPTRPDLHLWYRPQLSADGDYGPWVRLSGRFVQPEMPYVLAAENAAGRLEVFFERYHGPYDRFGDQGTNHLYQSTADGSWIEERFTTGSWLASQGDPILFVESDGRLDFLEFIAQDGQIVHASQVAPGGPWGIWRYLGNGPFFNHVNLAGARLTESPDGTLNLGASLFGAPPCVANTHLPSPESSWTPWEIDPSSPAWCPPA